MMKSVLVVGLLSLGLLQGCIMENRDDCPTKTLLRIVARDREGSQALPVGATLYLFDGKGHYLRSQSVTHEAIATATPIEITYPQGSPPLAVVWGNHGDHHDPVALYEGASIQDLIIKLNESNESGYHTIPANLYHGIRQLTGESIEEMSIAPKVGRLAITVKGLTPRAGGDYGFTAFSGYSHYDFAGTQGRSGGRFKIGGEFRDGKFVTTRPHNMIHHPDDFDADDALNVFLWCETPAASMIPTRAQTPIAYVNSDSEGKPLAIRAGQTTNVLLELAPADGGDIRVTVVLTPWDEIHQWNEW